MKITIDLTRRQLEDLQVCVNFALREGAGYGHATEEQEERAIRARYRLLGKLEDALYASKGG